MLEENYYKAKYKTAEGRVLYLIAKKFYGTADRMAQALGISRQFITYFFNQKVNIPDKYIGYLARKHDVNPALMAYDKYLVLERYPAAVGYYTEFVQNSQAFTKEDKAYILRGTYIKDPVKFIRQLDKSLKSQ